MNGTGKTVINIDEVFNLSYTNLTSFCKEKNIEIDELHHVYIKLKTTTIPTGMTISEYNSYIKKSLYNNFLDKKKSLLYRKTANFDDTDVQRYELEKALYELNKDEQDLLVYREEIEWLTKKLFRFIDEKGFTDYEIFLFKSYFLVPKQTYAKLNKDLNIDMSKIQRTIRKFKFVIRMDFLNWLKNNDK